MRGTRRHWTVFATLVFLFGALALVAAPRLRAEGVTCDGEPVTILGTAGDDVIYGTPGRDVIAGLEGNDTIRGLGGDDVLCGGPGDDAIDGGSGDNYIDGGPGKDACTPEIHETNCETKINPTPEPGSGGSQPPPDD